MKLLHFIKMVIKRAVWLMRDVRAYYLFTTKKAFGCSRGVFQSFTQATNSAPKYAKTNYTEQDEKESFQNFISNFSYKLADYEYPVFYHLNNILAKNQQAKYLILEVDLDRIIFTIVTIPTPRQIGKFVK